MAVVLEAKCQPQNGNLEEKTSFHGWNLGNIVRVTRTLTYLPLCAFLNPLCHLYLTDGTLNGLLNTSPEEGDAMVEWGEGDRSLASDEASLNRGDDLLLAGESRFG